MTRRCYCWVCNTLRRRWLPGAVAVVAVAALAAPAFAGGPNPLVDIQVLENADQTVLAYSIGDYRTQSVTIGAEVYEGLLLTGEPCMLEAGAPSLPKICRSIIIPNDAEMAVRVVSAEYYEVSANIAPSKGNLLRSVNPADVPYTFGEAYKTDAFYPGELAELSEPYILRDYRGVVVRLYPYQYNPVSRILRVYTDVTVEVAPVGPGQVSVFETDGFQRALSLSFHQLYQHQFVNYSPNLRYPPMDEDGDLLIIAHDAWIPNVQPLADHKNGIGINTTVVGVSTIGNNATAIKSYIQNIYDTSDLAFVLLVGDAAQVAPPYSSGGASDPSYAKLAGGDDYPEIMVGRISAENPDQVDTQVQRTIEYEVNEATTQDWFWRGTGIASNQGAGIGDEGQSDDEHMAEIREWLLAFGYTEVDEFYDPTATAAMVTTALNDGRGIINYCGHGSPTSWGTTGFNNSDINALVNDNMLPFITTVACNNGEFDSYTCFAEAWLRATNGSEPTGAIGCYASSVSQSWAPPMEAQDEFNLLYVAEGYNCYGTFCFAGSCSMMDDYGASGVDMFDTWILFGDPSLRIIGTVGPPHGMRVSPSSGLYAEGQQGGPFTPESIEYTLENFEEYALDYAVTNTQPWISLTNATGTIPALGTRVVTVSINSAANGLPNGHYEDTVEFVNVTNHDGDTSRAVTLTVGVPTMQHQWLFDSDPGWSTQGQWDFGQPTGQGGTQHGLSDPTSGATGTNVYGVNLNGDYSTTSGGPYCLSFGPVDMTNVVDVSLRFQRWLNTDYQPFVYATIEASNDGSNWTEIWSNGNSEITASAWSLRQYDISAIADDQPTVYIRWGYEISYGAWAYSGWNIDDVEIWGLASGYSLGDLNCDGVLNAFDIDPFVLALTDPAGYAAAWPNCDRMLADINGDGVVNAFDIDAFVDLIVP